MDYRLVLTVLFVMLSWELMGTNAQTNSTVPETNMTTPMMMTGNMTAATAPPAATGNMTAATAPPAATGNMTAATATPAPTAPPAATGNMTTATATPAATAPPAATGNMTAATATSAATGNMTTATPAATAPPAATATSSAATGNMTAATATSAATAPPAATGNMTTATSAATAPPAATGNMTAATSAATGNMTAAATTPAATATPSPTTTVPPLVPNTTVVTLETPVTREQCGTQQLCAAEPASCNPSTPGSCFFLGAKQRGGRNFEFQLSGQSEGYLAASLSVPGGNETVYICANNNSVVKFIGAILLNNKLVLQEHNVNNVKGKVNGNTIQCTFAATVPQPVSRATGVTLAVSTGSFNATSGALGTPNNQIRTPVVNLEDPTVNVTNDVNATTPAPTIPPLLAGNLASPVSSTGCRSEKLCAAEPSECNPSNNGSCFFLSAAQQSGQVFSFELSGQSQGYLAATLSTDTTFGNNDTTYVCANNNSVVQFISALLNNGQLNVITNVVTSVNGSVSGDKIQCEFRATLPNTTSTRAAGFALEMSTGTFDSATGVLGTRNVRIRTGIVDLTNVNATIVNLVNHAITLKNSLTQVLLITLSVLALMKL